MNLFKLILFLALTLGLAKNLYTQTILTDTLYYSTSGIDSYINSGASTTNYGTNGTCEVFYDYASPVKHYYSYFKMDYSSLPANAVVLNAQMKVYAEAVNSAGNLDVQVARITSTWTETGITFATVPSATSVGVDTIKHAEASNVGWHTAEITSQVQLQIANPTQNFGQRFLLINRSGTIDKGITYASSESSNTAHRPYMIIEYYVPQVDTIYLASDGYDAHVYSGATTTNYGTSTTSAVDWDYGATGSYARRYYLQADLSTIPRNETVISASINVFSTAVDNSATHPMFVHGVTSSWTEGGITWASQPSTTNAYSASITHSATSATGWQSMSIKGLAQQAVWSPEKNFGWRISLQGESGTVDKGVTYATRENGNSAQRPYVLVEHQTPIEISGGYVSHCTAGSNNGSITSLSATGGCYSYTSYLWRKLTNGVYTTIESGSNLANSAVSGLSDGLYLFTVTDYRGGTAYRWFFVGKENATTNVSFDGAGAAYIEDSWAVYYKATGDSVSIGNTATTVGCFTNSTYDARTFIQYQVDWDPSLEFTSARQAVRNKGGCIQFSNSDNDAWISRVTGFWEEDYVNWTNRPGVSTENRTYIPTTTTNGNEARNDTFNIAPLIPYWQEHPDESFGFELALNDFTQPATASRDYSSSDYTGHNLIISFTVKPKIETFFYDSLGTGEILVNAPAAALPYTYLIGYDTIPDLIDMWSEVKDSIAIDSLSFFRGKSNTRTYTFENIPAEHYFVAVFDNTGNKIFDEEILLTSATSFLSSTNLDNDSLKVKAGKTTGFGTFNSVLEKGESGAFEFEVEKLGDLVVGFNYQNDAGARNTSHFEYSVELDSSSRKFFVMKNDTVIFSDTLFRYDIFRIEKENFEFIVYKNEFEMYRHPMSRMPREGYKVDVLFKTAHGEIAKPVLVGKISKARPLSKIVTQTECGLNNGSIKMYFNTALYPSVTGGTYTIKEASSGATVESGTFSYPSSITEYLEVGDYKVVYTTTGTPAMSWTEYFTIGQPIIWDFLNAYYAPVGTSITTNTILNEGQAISQNILQEEVTEGFVTFKLGTKHYFTTWGGPPVSYLPSNSTISIVESDLDQVIRLQAYSLGTNIVTKYIKVFNGNDSVVNAPFIVNTEGPFKIKLYNDTLKTYYNNSPIAFAYVPQGVPDDYRVLATSRRGYVKDPFVDFCYGSSTSELCAELDYELNGNYYVTNNGYFCFVFNQEYNDSTITFNLYNISNAIVATQSDFDMENMIYGENRVVLDFTNNNFCLQKGYFVLEVINGKGEKFYLRFYNDYHGCLSIDDSDDSAETTE